MALRLVFLLALFLVAGCGDDDAVPSRSASPGTPGVTTKFSNEPQSWSSRAPVPTPRSEVAVATLDGLIYVIGGYDPTGAVSAVVEAYDPEEDAWHPVAPMPEPRDHTAAVGVDGKLYVFGGFLLNFGAATDTVFVYDPDTDAWAELDPMPRFRGAHAAVVLDDKVYLVGGATSAPNEDPVNVAEVDVFDPSTGQWTQAAPLPTPRDHLGAAVVGRTIYVIGGREQLDFSRNMALNEAYNPDADAWTLEPPMPTARSGLAVATDGERVYALGGEAPGGTFAEVEVFNPLTGDWIAAADLPTPRHGMGAVVIDNTLYVPSGGPTPSFSVTAANEALGPLVSD